MDDSFAGKIVTCRSCSQKIIVPHPKATGTKEGSFPDATATEEPAGALSNVRCYDCGQLIEEGKIARRDIETGSTILPTDFNARRFSNKMSHYERVSLCWRCCSIRFPENDTFDNLELIIAFVVVAAVTLGGFTCLISLANGGKPPRSEEPSHVKPAPVNSNNSKANTLSDEKKSVSKPTETLEPVSKLGLTDENRHGRIVA